MLKIKIVIKLGTVTILNFIFFHAHHFIIKELANEFKGQFKSLGENTENYKTFSFPTEKEIRKVDKDGNEDIITISYKIPSIDSARIWQVHYQILSIKCKDCHCVLEYECVNDILIKYKCLSCNKNCSNKIDEQLKKRLRNTFKFSNNDKFILLLRKGVYSYEYINEWEKFNETLLSKKYGFYRNLNMEDHTNDTIILKEFVKTLNKKNLEEYHDLYLKNNTLLLADVFENFRKMCLEIYELNSAKFLSAHQSRIRTINRR